jgi:hypothetical protein
MLRGLLVILCIYHSAAIHTELAALGIVVKGKPFTRERGWPEYHSYCTLAYALLNSRNIHTWFEFGVAAGVSINVTAEVVPHSQVIGFDTFTGLPTRWKGHYAKGAFTQHGRMPAVKNNVRLVKGLFNETLPRVLRATGTIDGMNIDCDLYSPTLYILEQTAPHWRRGTLLHFHEFNDKAHESEEETALNEFLLAHPSVCVREWQLPSCGLPEASVFVVGC